jgi:hypothetical protein
MSGIPSAAISPPTTTNSFLVSSKRYDLSQNANPIGANSVAVNLPGQPPLQTALIPYALGNGEIVFYQADGKKATIRVPDGSTMLPRSIADRIQSLISLRKFDPTGSTATTLVHGSEKTGVEASGGPNASSGVDKVTPEEAQLLAKAGIKVSVGVGDYWAVGIDTNAVLADSAQKLLKVMLRKFGMSDANTEKLLGLIKKALALATNGPASPVLRLELNGSFLVTSSAAQEASGNLHLKFSPMGPSRFMQMLPQLEKFWLWMNPESAGALAQLRKDLKPDGTLKPTANSASKAIYAIFVKKDEHDTQRNNGVPVPPNKDSKAPSKLYNQGPWKQFDSRVSISWYKWITKNDPNVRLGQMYVPLGAPEKLNDYLADLKPIPGGRGALDRLRRILSSTKGAMAPYVSPRLGLKNGIPNYVQLVFGAGPLVLSSENAPKKVQGLKPLFFPGFYIAVKLSVDDVKNMVRSEKGWIVPVSINGEKPINVEIPFQIGAQMQSFFGMNPAEAATVSRSSATASAVPAGTFIFQNVLKNIPESTLKQAEQLLKLAKIPVELMNNPKVADALEDIATVSSIFETTRQIYPPAAPLAGFLSGIIALAGRRSKNELDSFYREKFLPNLSSINKEANILGDMVKVFKSLQRIGEVDIKNFKGVGYSPAMTDDKEKAIAAAFSLYDRAIKQGIDEGKIDPAKLYAALKAASSSDDVTLKTLAKLILEKRDFKNTNPTRLIVPSGTEGVQAAVVKFEDFSLVNYFEHFKTGTKK